MQYINPMQYLAINVANYYGLDKATFNKRIDWVKDNLDSLENYTEQADDPILYTKAVQMLRKAMNNEEIGSFVFLDASASGLQIMSALTGCKKGATISNLIDSSKCYDAYSEITNAMNAKLVAMGKEKISIPRKLVKECLIVTFYGGSTKPKEIMGEYYPLFMQTFSEMCVGASQLLEIMVKSWQPNALSHSWTLPDLHQVYIPVLQRATYKIPLKFVPNYELLVQQTINKGKEFAVSNAANIIHSIDAYVLRQMVRRCNYDKDKAIYALKLIKRQLQLNTQPQEQHPLDKSFIENNIVDPVAINYINSKTVHQFSVSNLQKLQKLLEQMLQHKPFELVTVHDAFGCHPNNCEQMRTHYNNILADIADSHIISVVLSQIYGLKQTQYINKLDNNLSELIRTANYAIS